MAGPATTVLVLGARWAVDGLVAALSGPGVEAGAGAGAGAGAARAIIASGLDGEAAPCPDVVVIVTDDDATARAMAASAPARVPLLLVANDGDLAVELGATGWLPADADAERLRLAVLALGRGLAVVPAAAAGPGAPVLARLGGAARPGAPIGPGGTADPSGAPLLEPLTARELEVFELMANGLGNRDIAAALGISAHTAKFHVGQILDKTGAATRTEAVRLGLRSGLIGL